MNPKMCIRDRGKKMEVTVKAISQGKLNNLLASLLKLVSQRADGGCLAQMCIRDSLRVIMLMII